MEGKTSDKYQVFRAEAEPGAYSMMPRLLKTGIRMVGKTVGCGRMACFTFVVALVFAGHYIAGGRFTFNSALRFAPPDWLTRDPDSCRPSTNVAFLKTHKCASSAVQNILFRYGYAHGLRFALPDYGNYFGGPVAFDADMVRLTPWYGLGVNIFAIHTKWDFEQVKSVMPNDTVYISIIREPSELFESLYTYAEFEKFYKKTLEEFVESEDVDGTRYRKYLWYNQMAWDFGLPAEAMKDLDAVQRLVDMADEQFGLVMVTERMDESLVLLSHFLCWDLSDVVVLKVNARSSKFRTNLSAETQATLKRKLAPDYLLYDHFVRKFDRLVELFGRERMDKEVAKLRNHMEELLQKCNFLKKKSVDMKGPNKPWSGMVEGYKPDSNNRSCEQFSQSEISFINLLRGRQKTEALQRFGRGSALGLDALPLGAEALGSSASMMERINQLKKKLVYKEGSEGGGGEGGGDQDGQTTVR
ncbi:galactose-3-O-sulfotransferase 4-like isoform X1 [Penaeus monodon]|uniref:galactose-3-O-sulfotransferase 4-like isoform X1 n=1 Tax=Penaeus monodon TaxID=6687 RepID=UPI0018A79C27|nr:galactose-3-O-sulfotransferase 4-like isoform X1 [Penaeus monodon]